VKLNYLGLIINFEQWCS